MKRFFVLISNLLVSFFLIWVFALSSEILTHHHFPSVITRNSKKDISYKDLKETLTELADESNSLIGRTVWRSETSSDAYETFGKGKLPQGLHRATNDEIEDSGLRSNYYIFDGNLSMEKLKDTLADLGFTELVVRRPNFVETLVSFVGSGFQSLVILLFFLTFAALVAIHLVASLRSSGIRLIAGEKIGVLVTRPILSDLQCLIVGAGITSLLGVVFILCSQLPPFSIYLFLAGIFLYNFILLIISSILSLVFALGLKKINLINLIKGKLPLQSIFHTMLVGQFFSIILLALCLTHIFIYTGIWKTQEDGKQAWENRQEWFSMHYSREGSKGGFDKVSYALWYPFLDDAVSNHDALFVMTNTVPDSFSQHELDNYTPQGKTIYVTPNYLDKEHIKVSPDIERKVKELTYGEFVLLLPETLKGSKVDYEAMYREDISTKMSSNTHHAKVKKVIVDYIGSGKDRFLYNDESASTRHFLRDPIIVVITPKSTGKADSPSTLWYGPNDMRFKGLKETTTLLRQHNMYKQVAGIENSYGKYNYVLQRLRVEMLGTIAGAVLGILTSILLFNTMNLLYFEEFRREIFIKRVAGMRFFELHCSYLLVQLSVFLLGFGFSIFLTQNIWMSLIALLIFASNAFFLLQRQMKKEEAVAMTVLKGG